MTTAGSSKEKEGDREGVQKIIYKLKSQGYFDQFRKEFIADVDTKPAYKNLQQRVESYVSRFLSQQKWSTDLNKNNLRETLRRQINQSGMLNKGVERIVEQVVNPKIMQIIKPKVDEVTCDHLGISLEARNNEIKRKQQEQQEKMMKSPDATGIPCLTSLTFNSPPPGSSVNPFGSPTSTSLPPGTFNPVPSLLGPTPASYPPQIGNPFSNPAGLTFPGISQQSFPFLPPGWNTSMSTGFPPLFPPAVPPFQNFAIPPPGTAITVPPPLASGVTLPPETTALIPPTVSSAVTTRPSPGKGLNALLGLPTPSEEPPPPGTLILPDGSHIHRNSKNQLGDEGEKTLPQKFERIKSESESYESSENETGVASDRRKRNVVDSSSETDLPDIPLPKGHPSPAIMNSLENQTIEASRGMDFDSEADMKGDIGDEKRSYRFAWNEGIKIDEEDVNDSDVSSVHTSDVSSVHTSDLSNFEESDNNKDDDIKELENKLLLLQNEEGIGHVEETAVEVISQDIETQVEELEAETLVAMETVLQETTSAEPSPVKQPPEPAPVEALPVSSDETSVKARKPRKLLSLQYNYSDSEDEETREERKARIAKEKEERYQKRLQRRADMEAKRKEREEERLRQKREKLEKAKGAMADIPSTDDTAEIDLEDIVTVDEEGNPELETAEPEIVETATVEEKVDVEVEVEASKEEVTVEVEEVKEVKVEEEKEEIVEEKTAAEDEVEPEPEIEPEITEKEETPQKAPVDTPTEVPVEEPTHVLDTSDNKEHETSAAVDTSALTESSSAHDTSMAEVSSPEKKESKPRRKTKAELKAELKEQKVQARKSQRQRVRNRRYMSDEFVFKSPPDSSLSQSYDETMLIEETVEMEIDTEPQTIELNSEQGQLMGIPLPQETVDVAEVAISQDGGQVLTMLDGVTYVTTPGEGEQCVEEIVPSSEYEVTRADTAAADDGKRMTRFRNKEDTKSTSSISDQSDYRTGLQDKKRKRNVSQSSGGEPASKKVAQSIQPLEKRQLRSSDARTDKQDGKQVGSRQSYDSEDLYKPRHSYSRRGPSPPPLPAEPPLPPSDTSPPPLPPSPPPADEASVPPPPPDSPPTERRESKKRRSHKKRKNRSRSRSVSHKRRRRSRSDSKPRSVSSDSLSSISKNSKTYSTDSKSSYSRRKRSKSHSLSSISSDSHHSRSRSRSYSKSRSYSRSRSRSKSSSRSRSRSVSRSRSRSISSISSKRSSFSKGSNISAEERRRKARPVDMVDFGEAAKRARQVSMIQQQFPPRGPMGHVGPMGHMGPGSYIGPRGPGPYPGRGMPPMPRGSRGMTRGRYPSPHHMGLDVRPTGMSPSKPYYPPSGGPRYMPPGGAAWDDMHPGRSRRSESMYGDDDYYPKDDIHEGPGKTGITERGTLYREDTSPSPPPERRPMYTPPYRESSVSPPIPTGITERGTLYREDTSPSPPPIHRGRRMDPSPLQPPMRTRMRHETPSPPPIPRRRTISNRSESFESISPSPSPPPQMPVMKPKRKHRQPISPDMRNTPPVLRRSRGPPAGTPSPPSSGELTPSPPDLSHMRGGASPVSPVPMYPDSPRGPASPLESLTPTPSPSSPGMDRLEPVSPPSPPSPPRLRRGRGMEPSSPSYSPDPTVPPRLRRSSRNVSSTEEELHYSRSRRGQPASPPPLPRTSRRSESPPPVVETHSRQGKSKKHKTKRR